jgi:hypothetical protein
MRLVDSFPIVMAGSKRSSQARVAPDIANKGYCSSKNLYFYGVKLHVVAFSRPGTLPVPELAGLSPGSANDLTVLREALPVVSGSELVGDKAYVNRTLRAQMIKEQTLEIVAPIKKAKLKKAKIKKAKGQPRLSAADRLYSELVSRIRQPIESLFSWIEEKTGIQATSRVRSTRGLMVHVFGRFAAAIFLLAFNS